MAFRSRSTLQSWLDEFALLGYEFGGDARVLQQDGAEGADTGLVVVELADAATVITIQPETRNAVRWMVTVEAREAAVTVTAPALLNLAAALSVVAALCAFLQAKSLAYAGVDVA
ncbi:hypothetical protein [Microbacterium sp. NPDC056569]|uniref:hypothetical protein n=1 Tax=Microbacterium sp. NPDC056569 TaxID=3345867 RepID=UPI0036714984